MNQFLVWLAKASYLRRFPNCRLIFNHQREKLNLEKISGLTYFCFKSDILLTASDRFLNIQNVCS